MTSTVHSPVRIGILGVGGIATAHLNAYAAVSDRAKVTAIADVDPEALARREAETGATGYADFKELVKDRVLTAKMDLAALKLQIGAENKDIDKYEQELTLLGGLPSQAGELKSRIYWLLGKVQGCQKKVEGYEKEAAEMKKVLQTEF